MRQSIQFQFTLEDAIEMMINGESLYDQDGRLVRMSNSQMANNYGIHTESYQGVEYESLPCDAIPVSFDPYSDEDIRWVSKTYFSGGDSRVPISPDDPEIKEKVVTVGYECLSNHIDNQIVDREQEVKVPDLINRKEQSLMDKIRFGINHMRSVKKIKETIKNAKEERIYRFIRKVGEGEEVKTVVEEYDLFSEEVKEIVNMCNIRLRDRNYSKHRRKEIPTVRFFANAILRAKTQIYLKKVGVSIREAGLSRDSMVQLSKLFNKKDYQICQEYYRKTGKGMKMLKNRK